MSISFQNIKNAICSRGAAAVVAVGTVASAALSVALPAIAEYAHNNPLTALNWATTGTIMAGAAWYLNRTIAPIPEVEPEERGERLIDVDDHVGAPAGAGFQDVPLQAAVVESLAIANTERRLQRVIREIIDGNEDPNIKLGLIYAALDSDHVSELVSFKISILNMIRNSGLGNRGLSREEANGVLGDIQRRLN